MQNSETAYLGAPKSSGAIRVCFLSRQRITGPTNGSSAYALSICRYLAKRGFELHYLSPSPTTFGRWPWLRLSAEMRVFRTIRIRGGVRIGNLIVNLGAKAWFKAGFGMLDRIVQRFGLTISISRPAPYAVASPLVQADIGFLAKHGPAVSDAVLIDYAFLAEAKQFLGRDDAPNAILMHDLFSSRSHLFQSLNKSDSVVSLSEEQERDLLSLGQLILPIQESELLAVNRLLPGARAIVTPMAVQAADQPQPGENDTLLFVGSKTAPNEDALLWFLEEIWPQVRTARPAARLRVAGSVCASIHRTADGVEFLGIVPDLGRCYSSAGLVVSPLRAGSGLKIKLIEAMGYGKAIIASPVTLQGVENLVADAVVYADSAHVFAQQIIELSVRPERRVELGSRSLAIARSHFGEEACYGHIARHFASARRKA